MDAAEAAMASPLLEEGAIDGARGILINITGSSSLKLSEVNQASSLIQEAAHEDANIIFGAVLDEKMGEEVKITVIATGFRDQMPERRERMLNMERPAVVTTGAPVSNGWQHDQEPEAEHEVPVQAAAPRFFSQEAEVDHHAMEICEPVFFTPPTQEPISAPVAEAHQEPIPEYTPEYRIIEPAAGPEPFRTQFAEISENPLYASNQEYAPEFASDGPPPAAPDNRLEQPAAVTHFPDSYEESQKDLDVPAFMRRLRF
jgi:cell division protein FtsZ